MAAGHGSLGGALEGELVPADRVEDSRRQRRAVLADGRHPRRLGLPLEVDARGRQDANGRRHDLGADAVAGDEGDRVAHATVLVLQDAQDLFGGVGALQDLGLLGSDLAARDEGPADPARRPSQ